MFGLLSKFTEPTSITPWNNVKKALTAEEIVLHEEELLSKVFLACTYPHLGRKIGVPLFGSKTMRESLWYGARFIALGDILGADLELRPLAHMSDRGVRNLDKARLLSLLMKAKFSSPDFGQDLECFAENVERKLISAGIPVLQIILSSLLTPSSEENEQTLRKFEQG